MKKLAVLGLALAAVLPLGALDKTTVVLDWTINTNHTGLYVAQSLGYFTAEGLAVDIQPAPESGAVGLLASGRADFAVSAQEEVLLARSNGVPLTAVAAIVQHNTSGFAARKGAGITRPKDFEGKRYGGWGSPLEEATIRSLMAADGGDFSKVKVVNLGDQDFFAATEKNVDFAWVFEGWTVQEAAVRGVPLSYIDMRKLNPALDEYTPVFAAVQPFLDKSPAKAKAFLKALSKGYQYAVDHPAEAAAILLKAAPELNKDLVVASQKYLAAQYRAEAPRWGEFDPRRWTGFIAFLDKAGVTKAQAGSDAWATNAYLPPAAK